MLPQGYGYKVLLLDNLVADDSTIKCQVSKDRWSIFSSSLSNCEIKRVLDNGDAGLWLNCYFCTLKCMIPSFVMRENPYTIKIK